MTLINFPLVATNLMNYLIFDKNITKSISPHRCRDASQIIVYIVALILIPNRQLHSCCHTLCPSGLVFSQPPLLKLHARQPTQIPLTTESPSPAHHVQDTACYSHPREEHQPPHAHFRRCHEKFTHGCSSIFCWWPHVSSLSKTGRSAAFITVYRNLLSMLNVQLKAAMLPRSSGCATIKRTTWLDVFGSTRYRILCSLRQ